MGRLFLTTVGPVINVRANTISFQLYGEKVDFCFPPPTLSSMFAILPSTAITVHTLSLVVIYEIDIFDENKEPHTRSKAFSDPFPPVLAHFGDTSAHAREVVDMTVTPHGSFSLPPPSLLSTNLR